MSDLDALLMQISDGLPREPAKRYVLRCHPDVWYALRDAESRQPDPYSAFVRTGEPTYGHADITVDPDMWSGEYQITEDGEVIKHGFLAS